MDETIYRNPDGTVAIFALRCGHHADNSYQPQGEEFTRCRVCNGRTESRPPMTQPEVEEAPRQTLEVPNDGRSVWEMVCNYLMGTRQAEDIPDPEWIRGTCPECGSPLVSDMVFIAGKGYFCVWSCWNVRLAEPTCTFGRTL